LARLRQKEHDMPALADLKHNMRDLALKAHEVVKDEKLTTAEKVEQTEKYNTDIKSLSDEIKNLEKLETNGKSFLEILGGDPGGEEKPGGDGDGGNKPAPVASKSIGTQLVESEAFGAVAKALKLSSQVDSGAIELKGILDRANLKATLTEGGLGSANVVPQDRQPGILPILFERLTVADLMPSGATNSNTVRYAKESVATNAAAPTAEGATKPESSLNFTVVDEPVRKIATTMKVADEMLEDLPQMVSYVNGRMVLFVQLAEEAQLLTGDGTPPDLVGLLNRSGLTAAEAKGADDIATAIHKDITKIRVASFLEPDAIVFHPNDWEAAQLESDANGQWFGGGPFTGPYGNGGGPGALASRSYWGLRVVSTTAMTENTALLGAFATAAQIFRRSGITVQMTNSNEDDFKKNLVALRAEERLALAVYRPSAFSTVTGI
jgi:HK97 family phage major capsid protein